MNNFFQLIGLAVIASPVGLLFCYLFSIGLKQLDADLLNVIAAWFSAIAASVSCWVAYKAFNSLNRSESQARARESNRLVAQLRSCLRSASAEFKGVQIDAKQKYVQIFKLYTAANNVNAKSLGQFTVEQALQVLAPESIDEVNDQALEIYSNEATNIYNEATCVSKDLAIIAGFDDAKFNRLFNHLLSESNELLPNLKIFTEGDFGRVSSSKIPEGFEFDGYCVFEKHQDIFTSFIEEWENKQKKMRQIRSELYGMLVGLKSIL